MLIWNIFKLLNSSFFSYTAVKSKIGYLWCLIIKIVRSWSPEIFKNILFKISWVSKLFDWSSVRWIINPSKNGKISYRILISIEPWVSATTKCSTSAQFKSICISTEPKFIKFYSWRENSLPKSKLRSVVHPDESFYKIN